MSNDLEIRLKQAAEKAKPLIETLLADLEREATLIKERDLDPRKLAEEPKVQDARSAAVDALEHLTAFAKSLDTLVKGLASDVEKKVDAEALKDQLASIPETARSKIDVDALKEQLASMPETARSKIDDSHAHGMGDRIKSTGEDAKARLEASAHESREKIDDAAQKSKQHVASATHKGKDSATEMLAALGWAAAAGTVIYVVFMDEKRRRQAKSIAKATCNGLLVMVNSASKRN